MKWARKKKNNPGKSKSGAHAPPLGEAETGLETDVEGVGATNDAGSSDPADGFPAAASTVPGF